MVKLDRAMRAPSRVRITQHPRIIMPLPMGVKFLIHKVSEELNFENVCFDLFVQISEPSFCHYVYKFIQPQSRKVIPHDPSPADNIISQRSSSSSSSSSILYLRRSYCNVKSKILEGFIPQFWFPSSLSPPR